MIRLGSRTSAFCLCIPRYVRLFVRSTSSVPAGIACPTSLLLRNPHRACALLGLTLDSVSWQHCDTFHRLLDSGDYCVGVAGSFGPSSTSVSTIAVQIRPSLCVDTLHRFNDSANKIKYEINMIKTLSNLIAELSLRTKWHVT